MKLYKDCITQTGGMSKVIKDKSSHVTTKMAWFGSLSK